MEAVLSSKIAPNKGDRSRRLLRLNAMVVHRISASDTLSTDTTRDSENQNRSTQVAHVCAFRKGVIRSGRATSPLPQFQLDKYLPFPSPSVCAPISEHGPSPLSLF